MCLRPPPLQAFREGREHSLCSTVLLTSALLHTSFCNFFKPLRADVIFFPLSSLFSFVWSWTSRRCQTSASGRALEDVGRVLFPKSPRASYTRYINPQVWTLALLSPPSPHLEPRTYFGCLRQHFLQILFGKVCISCSLNWLFL